MAKVKSIFLDQNYFQYTTSFPLFHRLTKMLFRILRLDVRADGEQTGCRLLVQDHKTAFPTRRIVDRAVVNDMVWNLLFTTLTARKKDKPHLSVFEWNRPTPVRRLLNLTQADLGSLVPNGVGEMYVIHA